jgi:hypothetical protein
LLNRRLDRSEIAEYKRLTRAISDEIYDRDVMKTLK